MRGVQIFVALVFANSLSVLGQPPQKPLPQILKSNNTYSISVRGERVASSQAPIEKATAITLGKSNCCAATWVESREGIDATFFALRKHSGSWTKAKQADYRIKFQSGVISPEKGKPPAVDPQLKMAAAGDLQNPRAFCVQFVTQSIPDYQKSLKALGAKVLDYVPNYCHVVWMKPEVAKKVAELEFVRWVGTYQPAYKLSSELSKQPARTFNNTRRFNIYTIEKERTQSAFDAVEKLGATTVGKPGRRIFVADLTEQQLLQTLQRPEVQFVEKWMPPEDDMDNARKQGGADFIEAAASTPGGFTGIGIRGHVLEGINRDHPDFAANVHRQLPIILDDGSQDGHGQATFGIVFGSGINDPQSKARGMLPNAQGLFTNRRAITGEIGGTGSGSRYDLVRRLVQQHHVMFQTASWGNGRTSNYTARSAEMDTIIFDHDIPITQSQSNAGTQASRPQAWAKNIISVGGVAHKDNASPTDDSWRDGNASIGPAADGRIKPDLSAYYDLTRTTAINGYRDFGGTSGATPIVAGHLGLVLEMWTDGLFGNDLPNPGGSRFENRPHFSTAKALLIASAQQYDFSVGSTDNRREHQGWGFPNLKRLYEKRDSVFVVDESDVLSNLESKIYRLPVRGGEPDLKICLTYADPAGNPANQPSEPERLNDLTLKVTSPIGNVYWGNYGLEQGTQSLIGGSPDSVNTVECVFVSNPQAGEWQVEVSAEELLADSHIETPEIDADFALVALGVQRSLPPTLALCGQHTQFHLVGKTGSVLHCLEHHVNDLNRLSFLKESAAHWHYLDPDKPRREWAISKNATRNGCCGFRHAIWLYAPDLGPTFQRWKLIDRAIVVGPGHHCHFCLSCNSYPPMHTP